MKGRRSTPGRYFQVAEPGTGWGGTDISDPLAILEPLRSQGRAARPCAADGAAPPASSPPITSSTKTLKPVEKPLPEPLRKSVERIEENCEPALCTVLFMGGAGGSLRAGVTENPVRLTRSVKDALTYVTCGGAPVYVWPGGGITFMVDVTARARQRLRLCADAGAGRADRVHAAALRLRGARRPYGPGAAARGLVPARAPASAASLADNPWPFAPQREGSRMSARRRSRCCRTAAGCIAATGRSI